MFKISSIGLIFVLIVSFCYPIFGQFKVFKQNNSNLTKQDITSKHAFVDRTHPFINMETCGLIDPKDKNKKTKSRILMGEVSDLGEFPWQAYIYHKLRHGDRSHVCNGVLIHKYWILTSRFCIDP